MHKVAEFWKVMQTTFIEEKVLTFLDSSKVDAQGYVKRLEFLKVER